MTIYKKYFIYRIGSKENPWFEHSNIGFEGIIDDRPLFDQYNAHPLSSWSGPKFRLVRELHDIFCASSTHYRIHQVTDPATYDPVIRCDVDKLDDNTLLLLKLTWNIEVLNDGTML